MTKHVYSGLGILQVDILCRKYALDWLNHYRDRNIQLNPQETQRLTTQIQVVHFDTFVYISWSVP